jgi:ATP-dependent RNA helicase RhlE
MKHTTHNMSRNVPHLDGHERHPAAPVAVPETALHGVFLDLIPELRRAIAAKGYSEPTPIQTQTIPYLVQGRDLIGCAQTGTGKTAAFALPILQYLNVHNYPAAPRKPRVLVVAPTRELAAQIDASFAAYGRFLNFRHTVVFGGVSQNPQVDAIERGIAILIATPGRLLDLMGQGVVALDAVEIFVLDEADRMLDMGFLPDIKRIIKELPPKRQSLFFSATMEPPVVALARSLVHDPVHVTVTPEQPTVEKIVQHVMFVDRKDKDDLLISLLRNPAWQRVIVFTQMKHVANKVTHKLQQASIPAVAIHGNKSQAARTEALADFKRGRVRVLVATDLAARGLDVTGISHVINYDLPTEPEVYVHRIGRTARAGADGDAISFCSAPERELLRGVEKFLRRFIPINVDHPYHSDMALQATGDKAQPLPRGARPPQRRPGFSSRPRR